MEKAKENLFTVIFEKYQPKHLGSITNLMDWLEELGDWTFEGIVGKKDKKATKQIIEGDPFPWTTFEYVYQYCNGGFVGDDYAGFVYLPIAKNKYLLFQYQC